MRDLTAELQYARWHWQWRLMKAGIPALLVATEVEQIPHIAEGICYDFKTPLLQWVREGDLFRLIAEMEMAAREYWV